MLKKGESDYDADLRLLKQLKGLAWLSNVELSGLRNGLATNNFKRHEVMLAESGLTSEAHILLTGVAKITCLNTRSERVTVALVPPSPIPEFPSQLPSRWRFQCNAYSKLQVRHFELEPFQRHCGRRPALRLQGVSPEQSAPVVSAAIARLHFSQPEPSRTPQDGAAQVVPGFRRRRIAWHAAKSPLQPQRPRQPGGCLAAQGHRAPRPTRTRARGFSPGAPTIVRTHELGNSRNS